MATASERPTKTHQAPLEDQALERNSIEWQPLPEAPAAVATVARVDEKVHNLRRALELQLGRV